MVSDSAPPRLHVERMMHRQSVAVTGESLASYALVKLIPTGGASSLPLNLAIVLDVSGSMYEEDGTGRSRLTRVQDAALAALGKLRPTDTIAVIAFGNNAQVVLPATPWSDRSAVEDVIRRIDRFDVEPSGTVMDQGLRLALSELAQHAGSGKLSQIVLLTDGETAGESVCRELAQEAARRQVRCTFMGVGTEWNSSLIKDLARLSEGRWHYIDVQQAEETQRIFLQEFEQLADAALDQVELHLKPVKDVKIKRVRLVSPEIKDLPLDTVDERHLKASLGPLGREQATKYILDLSLPQRPDGNYAVVQLEVRYIDESGRKATVGPVALEVAYTAAGNGYVNAEVARHIDEVHIYEMNLNLQQALATDNSTETKRLAEQIARKGDLLGPKAARKTMLARQVLDELGQTGRVSRKTMLAVDDAARQATEA